MLCQSVVKYYVMIYYYCDDTFLCVLFRVISPVDAIVFNNIELLEVMYVFFIVESKVSQVDEYLVLHI